MNVVTNNFIKKKSHQKRKDKLTRNVLTFRLVIPLTVSYNKKKQIHIYELPKKNEKKNQKNNNKTIIKTIELLKNFSVNC